MPKELEDKLSREADSLGYTGDRKKAYVYGTMNRRGLLGKKGRAKAVKRKLHGRRE